MITQVLHLKTQRNQPYGSQRRCCEECGTMIWVGKIPTWTDDPAVYANPPAGYHNCTQETMFKKDQRVVRVFNVKGYETATIVTISNVNRSLRVLRCAGDESLKYDADTGHEIDPAIPECSSRLIALEE